MYPTFKTYYLEREINDAKLLSYIFSEHLVFIQGGAATPIELVRGMTEHGLCNNLRGVRLLHMSLEGDAPFANPEFESTIFVVS